uniref:Non-specific serine/threonine protein kinase n=1 Tax=Schistosoma mansoni TaxID=6183 RepID=A0A3Q0KKW5_SCHMA
MRTRNRGQKRSIVSSLGLGPKFTKHKSVVDLKCSGSRRGRTSTLFLRSQPRTRWSSEGTRTRVGVNLGRPRIRKRGSRGLCENSRLHCTVRLESKTCSFSSDPLVHTVYATRTKSKGCDSFTSINHSSTLRSRISKIKVEDESKFDISKPGNEVEPKLNTSNPPGRPFSRGVKRGRPRFSRGLPRSICDTGANSARKSVDFISSETTVQSYFSKKCDSPLHNTSVIDCVYPESTLKPDKPNGGNYISHDNKSDVKKEDSEIPANLPLPAKRRRGRPPLKLCSALVSKASAPIKSEIKEVIQDEIQESVYLPQDSHHSYPEITKERRFSSIDLVRTSCTASPFQLRFGATDDVLQEVLNEVNEYGFVKLPVKRIRKGRQKPTTPPGKVDENQFVMSFDSLSVERIFDSICKEDKLNDDLASKDLFLAMSGLLRPGVCEVWRRRREDRSKQLSRNLMGRLRPNPRPRRYSDMISQSSHRSHIDGLISLDGIHNNEKTRHQSTRPTTVSAARLTAAKKLIRAKSHVQSSLQITPIRSQSTGYVDELCLDSRAGRSAHRTPKMNVSISSRTSRHPDVSHHIDWKFCYVSSSKQNEVTGLSNSLQRRQRQSSFNSKGRMENVGNFSPIRSLDNSPYNLEQDSLEDSCDIHKTDMGNQIQLKPENRVHLQINNPNDVERFNINYNKSIQLSGDRRLERRRKKRRAITFQRKRPNERFLTSHRRDNWYSDKTYLRDDSSASSSTSKSGIVDAYGRSFRQARWYHHRPEIGHSERTGSSYCCHSGLESRSLRKSERSLSSRRIHTSSKFSSRRIVLPEPNHSHASRHRIPRRPDRMCQLTLLDRLVLGLNCSVSQNDDEIHIKQLHAEELNILTQRMSRTGFFIQSLALRQNANNDAEYNIVLTFSSESEAGTRRTRCPNSLFRSKLDSHDRASICRSLSVCDQNAWKKVKSHNRSRRISCLASRHSYLSHSRHISKFHHYKDSSDSSLLVGYQSDSGLLVHRSANYVREFHSDCEESGTLRYKHFEKLSVSRKVSHHVLYSADSKPGHYYSVFGPLDKASLRHLQVNSSSGSTKIETHRSCLPPELSYITSNTDVHKRSTILSRISSVKDDEHINVTSQESSTIHISNSSNTNSNNSSHGVSKREANFYIVGAVQNLPFRRHSPRKVIRKVYTGSLTIPKILNRKRIPALPTNPLGGPSVSIPVTSTNSLTSTLVTNSIVSAVSCSTSSSSVGLNSCAPTLLFHDAQSVPIYSSATHLRRLQATVTSLSIVQNPVSTTEQSKISVPPLAVIPSVITDPQTVTKVKMQNSDIAATLHDTLNQPEASASVETTNHGDLPRDHLSGSVTVERVTSENYGEQNVSKANPTDANDPITKTPETEVGVKDFLSDVISSETDIKSVNPVVTSGTDTCPSGSAPYNVVSAASSYTFTAANPFNDEEPILGMDDSQTPATSLSASQLLKLKRLHDEVGRPIQRRDSKSPRCSSHTPSQVQSPIYLPARSQNQSQPLESEAIVTRCPQTSQLQQSQQSIQYTSSVLSNTSGLNSEFRPFPVHLNQDPAHKSNPKLEIDDDDDDDMEDFELKNVTKMYEPSVATSFQSSVPSHKLTSNRFFDNSALSTVPTTISSEPEGLPFMTAHYPTVMRAPRINWPIGRPTFNPTLTGSLRLPSQCFNPLVPATVRCFTEADQNTGSRIVGQGLSTPRASTNDSVGDHFLLSGKPFISSSVSPIFSGSGGIPIMTTVQSSTNASVFSGPPKRTVVHKYHSFRKILPKSDRPVMLPTAPGFSISPFSTNTADLGRFSVPSSSFGMYRPGSLGANTVLPCEVTTSRTYIMDIGTPNLADDSSSIPIRRNLCATSLALANSNQSVLATNPASQLLKSLLERDDSRSATGVVTTFAAENNLSFSMSTVVSTSSSTSGSGTPLWNQPAHQSRGTWQLGKRAVSSSNHRSPPDSVSLKISHTVFPTSTSSQPHSSPTSSNPPPILPPTLRLTPGPTSRLQQLQQHYQRQQEAQRRFEQDSLSKLGVADSV